MNVVKFKEQCSNEKNHIIFCIVDKTDSYKNNKEIIFSSINEQNATLTAFSAFDSYKINHPSK
jgi:hypothetical protein